MTKIEYELGDTHGVYLVCHCGRILSEVFVLSDVHTEGPCPGDPMTCDCPKTDVFIHKQSEFAVENPSRPHVTYMPGVEGHKSKWKCKCGREAVVDESALDLASKAPGTKVAIS